jgi:hypothetical protein
MPVAPPKNRSTHFLNSAFAKMVDFGGSFFFLVSKECSGSKLWGAVEF